MRHDPKAKIAELIDKFRSDYQHSTMITSGLSACVNIAFSLFNGIFGLIHFSVWHLSVCVYYIFLLGIRGHILMSVRKQRLPRPVYIRTHVFLILMNILMIIPISIMVRGERAYTYGLIPAIAIAAYTTYRITMAAIQLKKSRKNNSLLIKELRLINFVDSLMAIITLQNTLIMANGGMTGEMKTLCSWTNGGIFLLMLCTVIRSFYLVKSSAEDKPNRV